MISHGSTLVCRGTAVVNHWVKVSVDTLCKHQFDSTAWPLNMYLDVHVAMDARKVSTSSSSSMTNTKYLESNLNIFFPWCESCNSTLDVFIIQGNKNQSRFDIPDQTLVEVNAHFTKNIFFFTFRPFRQYISECDKRYMLSLLTTTMAHFSQQGFAVVCCLQWTREEKWVQRQWNIHANTLVQNNLTGIKHPFDRAASCLQSWPQ